MMLIIRKRSGRAEPTTEVIEIYSVVAHLQQNRFESYLVDVPSQQT